MTAAVGDPDVVFRINVNTVRAIPKHTFSEGPQILSILIELDDGLGIDAVSRPADHPQVSFRIEFQVARKAHFDAVRESEAVVGLRSVVERWPLLHDEQVLFVGARSLGESGRTAEHDHEDNGQFFHAFSP